MFFDVAASLLSSHLTHLQTVAGLAVGAKPGCHVRAMCADRKKVAGGETYEVNDAAKKAGAKPAEVSIAVKEVGNSRAKVEEELKK